jgi:hypothetical protein
VSINEISLSDPTDRARPIDRALNLCVVGDLAFVSICTVDEGNPTTTTTVVAQMTVSRQSLRDAMVLLSQDADRESLRPTDERGEGMPDLAGNRFVVTPA